MVVDADLIEGFAFGGGGGRAGKKMLDADNIKSSSPSSNSSLLLKPSSEPVYEFRLREVTCTCLRNCGSCGIIAAVSSTILCTIADPVAGGRRGGGTDSSGLRG